MTLPPAAAQWLSTGIIAVTAASAYVYLEGLREETAHVYEELMALGAEQRQLDQNWLASDNDQHGEILIEIAAVRAYIEARLTDGSLLYDLGLRDGARACNRE